METIGLSFDIEDWFCVQNMKDVIPFNQWNQCESRVYENTEYLLKTLKKNNIKATFFVLAWIAERIPELVYDIASDGHEIASHGYSHSLITHMTKKEFQTDLEKSISILTNLTGKPIYGYRAPSFSITRETMWALEILKKNGIKYDSSIYPIKHPDYGIAGFQQDIHEINGIIEVPLTTSTIYGLNIPISGGGYFRLYPYWFSKMMLQRQMAYSRPITYFHPWEFDSGQPRINLPWFKKFRHYVGLEKNRNKFEKLLQAFYFAPIENIIRDHRMNRGQPAGPMVFHQEVAY